MNGINRVGDRNRQKGKLRKAFAKYGEPFRLDDLFSTIDDGCQSGICADS